ncbi:ATP-binding protein [Vibrio sp.]|uniref:ATP-binding protein n=1 Tax=Vibrio sp. TaxID=678 RepID=UPI003D145347
MKNKRQFSIKRRLSLSVILLSCTLILVSFVLSMSTARHEVEEVYDARLGQSAKLLLMATAVAPEEFAQLHSQELYDRWMKNLSRLSESKEDGETQFGHPYEQNIVYQFYLGDKMIWSADNTLPPLSPAEGFQGYGYGEANGSQWRYFQLQQSGPGQLSRSVLVAEKKRIRSEVIDEVVFSTTLPQLVLIPCLVFLLLWLIDRNFKPIQALISAIDQRSAQKLDRIHVEDPTVELSPLVNALNELLAQLEKAWQHEKRFTRMAAHELKTPLTVLRLNAENALNSQNADQLAQDLNHILKGIDRTDRLLQQLLTLARVETLTDIDKQPVELSQVLKQTIADLAPVALHQQQKLGFDGEEVTLSGDELLLGILFRNLIDNAIRYSGHGSHIDVSLIVREQQVDVLVADSGSPIAEADRSKLFDNFYRGSTEKGDGAGLGMAITQYIASLHNATVTLLDPQEQGNVFRVRFLLN